MHIQKLPYLLELHRGSSESQNVVSELIKDWQKYLLSDAPLEWRIGLRTSNINILNSGNIWRRFILDELVVLF